MKNQKVKYLLISYNTARIQDICFNSSTAIKCFGEEIAKSLQTVHSDIQAAANIYELPIVQITVDDNTCTLKFSNFLSLLIVPNYEIGNDDDIFDWNTVERVKIMGVNNVK
jgi:hypothetical protein